MSELADELRRLREQRGLTQAALAFKTGLSHSVIYRAEMSESVPSRTTLRKLEEALEVPDGLIPVAERMRAREEEFWIGFPHTIWAAPLISSLSGFSGPFQLVGCHFGEPENDGTVSPLPSRLGEPFQADRHRSLDGVSLMEALVARALNGAWLPRATYLAHQDSLNRYACLSALAPPVDLLVVPKSRRQDAPLPTTIGELRRTHRVECCLHGEGAKAEYAMVRSHAEDGRPPVVTTSYPELAKAVEEALTRSDAVLCMVNEPFTTLIRKHGEQWTGAECFTLRRRPEDYTVESLMNWRGVHFDFVLPKQGKVVGAWIKAYLGSLRTQVQFVNAREKLERVVARLGIDLPTVRAKLDEADARFELLLDPNILQLFPA